MYNINTNIVVIYALRSRRMVGICWVCFGFSLGCIIPTPILASEILAAEVAEQSDVFQVYLKMRINASYAFVYNKLTDYPNIHTISQSINESTVLNAEPPRYRVKLVSEGCIWFVCRSVTQVQDVGEVGNGQIKIRVDAKHSDIRQSQQFWHVQADNRANDQPATVVSYRADIEPDFWIPPLLGSWLFKQRLLEEGQYLLTAIEQLAIEHQAIEHLAIEHQANDKH